MKKRLIMFLMIGLILGAGSGFSAPERIALKSEGERLREGKAMTSAKAVDLNLITDPEVRQALKVVFDALNLKTKK